MDEKIKKIIQENILLLPKEAQEVLNSFDWLRICEEIGRKYQILEPEIFDFKVETGLVLLGLEKLEFYAENIENEAGITKEKANNLANEATERVLKPIVQQIENKVKEKVKDNKQKWNQNVDFIISGGNYSAFIDKRTPIVSSSENSNSLPVNTAPNTDNLKKGEDLKSKFTI